MLNQFSTIEPSHDREEIEQVQNLLFQNIQLENERHIAAPEAQMKELGQSVERQMRIMVGENSASQAHLIDAMGSARQSDFRPCRPDIRA